MRDVRSSLICPLFKDKSGKGCNDLKNQFTTVYTQTDT